MRLIRYIDGTHTSFLANILLFPLYVISLIYELVVRIRLFFYSTGLFRVRQLPCQVISVGNITVGGSGKTPMAIHLAKRLTDMGRKVAIISRGYKGRHKGVGIVSDGNNIFMDSLDAGDEPILIASKTRCPVIIGKDRYKAGLLAMERFKPDLIILDDGFQHIKLKRDKDIVLIDSIRGFGNGHLLPRGILREPVGSLKRATHIFINGDKNKSNLQSSALSLKPVFFKYKPTGFINLSDGSVLTADKFSGKSVLAFSGIANPASFFNTLKELNIFVKKDIVFFDHHQYNHKHIDIIKTLTDAVDYIITTEKDGVKIKKLLPLDNMTVYALMIDVVIHDEQELLNTL